MKEKIYTIPINEAYDTPCECPMCLIEDKLEQDAVEYVLGAAMMEPDFRVDSNKTGYCKHHFSMMFQTPKKLPLALILETHVNEIRENIEKFKKKSHNEAKPSLFKKGGSTTATDTADYLARLDTACMVCSKMETSMSRYRRTLPQMWAEDTDFRTKFDRSNGLCLKHCRDLLISGQKVLKGSAANDFTAAVLEKEYSGLTELQEELHKFTLKFDYRNRDMELGDAKDSPKRAIEKITGTLSETE